MDEFCGSPFWQANLTWNTTSQPDLTPCFQETVLAWIPCFLLWFFAPLDMISIYKSERRYIPVTLLNLFKAFLSTVLCLLSVAEFIEVLARSDSNIAKVEYVTPIIKSVTFILAFGLSIFHRNKGVHTSGLMLMFWFLMSITSIVNMRSIILSSFQDQATAGTVADWQLSEFKLTLRIISAPIVVIQVILSCFADKKAQDPFMVAGEGYRNRSPENDASVLSRLNFWWLNRLMWTGYKRPLTQDDLYAVRMGLKTEVACQKFDQLLLPAIRESLEAKRVETFAGLDDKSASKSFLNRNSSQRSSWIPLILRRNNLRRQQSSDQRPAEGEPKEEVPQHVGVTRIIIKVMWPMLSLSMLLRIISSTLSFANPLLLQRIIKFVSSNDEPSWRGLFYAGLLFTISIMDSLIDNREQYITSNCNIKITTWLVSALYRKTLKVSSEGRKQYTTGQIVNLMSNDALHVSNLVQNLNILFVGPLQLIITMYLLYQQLGVAIFAGLAIMLINVPLNGWVAVRLRTIQQSVMRQKDKRIKLLSEVLQGMKIVKIHAWEDSFKRRLESVREKEIESLTKQTWYSAAITFTFACLPFVVVAVSFTTYVLMDSNNFLDASRIFVSLALFDIIRIPLAILPMLITNLSMFIVSVRRLNKFFEADEIDPDAIKQVEDGANVIKIENASFRWERKGELTLDKINFTVPRRKLVAVVGPVGSGKSSLISSILGDLEKCDGEIKVDLNSSMAYVPQEAWILNTTFKNNIMFNKVVNEDKYQRILEASALLPDLKTFELGDQEEIGEKGINLSGGQKQRVSLARAIYSDSDIYLLDDPLNAVDAHVSRHIFNHVIGPKGMLRDRTRILVTNKLSFLPEVDYIYVMKDGRITEEGTYENLLRNKGLFSQLLVKFLLENTDGVKISENARADLITKELKRLEEQEAKNEREQPAQNESRSQEMLHKQAINKRLTEQQARKSPEDSGDSGGNLTGREVSQIGSVGLDIHVNFIRNMGMMFLISVMVFILSSAFTLSSNYWLSEWSNDALNETLRNNTEQRNKRLGVYVGLGVSESIFIIVSTILMNLACLNGSKILHNRMLSRVLRAPLSWFNITPSGRILNRFSKDVDTVDSTIRFNVRLLLVTALKAVTSLIMISLGSAYTILFIVPMVLLYFLFQIFYVSTSRQLKRIQSTTKSPIFSHFSETLLGTSSIRAFKVEQEFQLQSNHLIDTNNASWYINVIAARWLSHRLEVLGFIVVLTASLVAVLSRGTISPGIAGLSVTYSLSVTTVLSYLVRNYSDYETNVVCVERLIEYTRINVEPDDEEEPSDPDWPAKGAILFDEFSARYRPDLELVLNKFNLNIDPAIKIGLVGRTGAGKSSVTLALFRILEAAEGRIVIDDVDISHINLKLLRSKLSIIPQDPILFTGTIRQNVDPTEEYSDEQVWKAIDLAHMSSFIRSLPSGLDHQVSEGGSNFSVGQKQLFCLARTLLRRSKILILDEATAAVDVETDSLIQETIRREFKDSTILTIAHRLETIQDYDRVVVMENGASVEEGSPKDMLKNPTSKFLNMAKEAGLLK